MPPTVYSFPPIARPDARILILGSMPGKASLEAGEYYAHPRNAFWRVVEALFAIERARSYRERCAGLIANRVALWDVLKACVRPGSLDAAIVEASIETNDFAGFFEAHPGIEAVYFNGAKASDTYSRRVLPSLPATAAAIPARRLPSTSPAYAALSFEAKLAAWRVIARRQTEASQGCPNPSRRRIRSTKT